MRHASSSAGSHYRPATLLALTNTKLASIKLSVTPKLSCTEDSAPNQLVKRRMPRVRVSPPAQCGIKAHARAFAIYKLIAENGELDAQVISHVCGQLTAGHNVRKP